MGTVRLDRRTRTYWDDLFYTPDFIQACPKLMSSLINAVWSCFATKALPTHGRWTPLGLWRRTQKHRRSGGGIWTFWLILSLLDNIDSHFLRILFNHLSNPLLDHRSRADQLTFAGNILGKIRQLLHTTFAPTKLSQNYTFARHPRCSWLLFVLCIERFSHRVGSSPLDRLTADCILLLIHRTSLSWK